MNHEKNDIQQSANLAVFHYRSASCPLYKNHNSLTTSSTTTTKTKTIWSYRPYLFCVSSFLIPRLSNCRERERWDNIRVLILWQRHLLCCCLPQCWQGVWPTEMGSSGLTRQIGVSDIAAHGIATTPTRHRNFPTRLLWVAPRTGALTLATLTGLSSTDHFTWMTLLVS